jgi:hypothetical protein
MSETPIRFNNRHARWKRFRAWYLEQHPVCSICRHVGERTRTSAAPCAIGRRRAQDTDFFREKILMAFSKNIADAIPKIRSQNSHMGATAIIEHVALIAACKTR